MEKIDAARHLLTEQEVATRVRRASRSSVRGLRRCNNESCAVSYWNRDVNAARNIGRRCVGMLKSDSVMDETPELTSDDAALDSLQSELSL